MFIAILVVLNLIASIYIVRRDDLEKSQKIIQIVVIWVIPLIAAIGLWLFHKNSDKPLPPKKPIGGGPSQGPFDVNGPGGE